MDRLNILSKPEYSFLEDMKKDCLLIGLSGSHSYGTNVDGSDIDVRGIRYNSVDTILGIKSPSFYKDGETDTTIYDLNKVIPLLMAANPNIIEMLGLEEEDYIYVDDFGKKLINNAHIFLSKDKVKSAFGGYATSQLKKLQQNNSMDKKHICKHTMHLIRLLFMGWDILTTGRIETKMSKDNAEVLLAIRNGDFYDKNSPLKMNTDLLRMYNSLEVMFNQAYENSKLPEEPDYKAIKKLLMQINYATVVRGYVLENL